MNGGAAEGAGRRGLWTLATVLLCSLGAYLALELWRAKLTVPFRYSQIDDTKFYFALVKGIIEHGWYEHNANLAAPFGQALYDFPQGADNLNFLLIKAIAVTSSNYALVTNLFFLLTFPLTGLAAHFALRRLGVGPAAACVCAVLFALLPFHFYRHESQVLLSAYYAVPLGAYLFLSLFGDAPPLARREGGRPGVAWASRRTIETLVICVVIGSAGLYYAVFTVALLVFGTVVGLFAGRGRRTVASGVVTCLAIAITLTVNLSPTLLNTARHGGNPRLARGPVESEQLGLRLSNLVLPVRGHRLKPLAGVNARYAADTSPGYCESCNETLGVVGAAGFVLLCLIGLAACIGGAADQGRLAWHRPFRPAALGVALALAIGTIGGISALIAFLVTPDVRGWNRISLFIAFFSLMAAGLVMGRAGRRLAGTGGGRVGRRTLAGGLLLVLLVVGGLDETSNYFVVDYATSGRLYASDQAFGRTIESHLPAGTNVLELPYVPFPEGYHIPGQPPASAFSVSYELLRPYLSTSGLNWSFGAIKGRPGDWEGALAAKRIDLAVAGAAAAGFGAIYVDPRGYDPATAAKVEAGLTRLLGAGPLVAPRADAWLFDLRPYVRRLRGRTSPAALAEVRDATLHPLLSSCGASPAQLILSNPGRQARVATLSASVTAPLPGGVTLSIGFPDGSVERRKIGAAATRLEKQLRVAPGTSQVHISIVGVPPFGASPLAPPFVIGDLTLTDQAFAPVRARPIAGSYSLPVAGLTGPTCDVLYAATGASHLPSAFPPRPPRKSL